MLILGISKKVYPKDHFPLPRIDQIVDSTSGCERLCFLDAYSGYHQIRLYERDELKTAFITPFGCFVIPRLKNVGATYQRMMQNYFIWQIGKNVEVYVDDIVIKSAKQNNLSIDLAETLQSLRA